MRRLWQRWSGVAVAVLFLVAGTAGFYVFNSERRRNDIEICEKVQAAVDAIEGNRDVLLSFAPDPNEPRAVKFRHDTDAQIAKARQDCSELPRP